MGGMPPMLSDGAGTSGGVASRSRPEGRLLRCPRPCQAVFDGGGKTAYIVCTTFHPPPMPKIRTTITIDDAVLARYQRAADQQGESLSRTISGWLEASAEGAEQVAMQIQRVKQSPTPGKAAQRLSELLAVVGEGYEQAVPPAGRQRPQSALARDARGRPVADPPACNTGGKVPRSSTARQGS